MAATVPPQRIRRGGKEIGHFYPPLEGLADQQQARMPVLPRMRGHKLKHCYPDLNHAEFWV